MYFLHQYRIVLHVVSGNLMKVKAVLDHNNNLVPPTQEKPYDLQVNDDLPRIIAKPEDLLWRIAAGTRGLLGALQIVLQGFYSISSQGPK
jgi:hypothetical protein